MKEHFIYPFAQDPGIGVDDNQLIDNALKGNRGALEDLVKKHQPWIYNLAFRMVLMHPDAEDVTQEILIKMITKLSTFDSKKAAFRTWLYRIVVNHVINMKKRNYENAIPSLENYYTGLANVPDEEPQDTPEIQMVISDLKIGCLEGVILCLDRRQRVVFILSVVFGVPDAQGSEILEISKSNYRKILSRGRAKLYQYMNNNCSVINEECSCKCRNKVTGIMKAGGLSPDRISFAQPGSPQVKDVILQKADQFNDGIYSQYVEIYREHPFYKAPDITEWFREMINKQEFKQLFQLD